MRLLLISIGSLFFTAITLSFVHLWGLSQPIVVYDCKFFKSNLPKYIYSPKSITESEKYVSLVQDPVLYLEVKEVNSAFMVSTSESLASYLENKSLNSRFILNINSNVVDIHQRLSAFIENYKAQDSVAIISNYEAIIKSVKDILPTVAYGNSISDTMRFLSFDSMFILPATPYKGDFFILPTHHRNQSLLNANVAEEIKRRKIKFMIGPIQNNGEWDKALSLGADAFITSDLEYITLHNQ